MNEQKESLIRFYRRHQRMPGYQEMMVLWGYKSKNAVYKLIQKLVDAGVICKDSYGHITPANGFSEIKLLGLVEAGFPSPAEEMELETLSLDDFLVGRKGASFMLTVKGDSMVNAGIREGDRVIAERGSHATDGDIVVAEMDGGWTMKYFRNRNGHIYLEPANKRLHNMYPEEDLRIEAHYGRHACYVEGDGQEGQGD